MHDLETDERHLATRQIAILLQALPARTHRVLVGQLSQDDKLEINQRLKQLGQSDPLEQYRVMKLLREELQAGTNDAERVESEIQDEIQIGRARVSRKRRTGSSYLSPEIKSKSAESAETPPPVTNRIANTAKQNPSTDSDATTDEPVYQVSSIRFSDFYQSQAVGVMPASGLFGQTNQESPEQRSERSSSDYQDLRPPRLRRSTATTDSDQSIGEDELLREIDKFLQQLPPRELCRALAMVTTRQAFLVLCGLPNEKAEAVLALLPRRKAKKVRSDMRSIGPLQLSDIDDAKRVLAEIAIEQQKDDLSVAA
ncbi:hypothetical protein LOC67_05855 [Stieleria sp. JC731]|uniref:FliG C-terminal domain-containing protein n=1 Tax=Pirellulaceae TaxID=2691357 RepID=UPI001E3C3541|nr:FliG C-terminal domain-containing protein [Stieleria sp. JC731]MCC9600078.1 hypothetical protein [Stieleria sp. JC731]